MIVRRSREVRSWLDSIDVACARRTRELAAAGHAEPAESLLGDAGQRSSHVSRPRSTSGSRSVTRCRCSKRRWRPVRSPAGHVDAVAAVLAGLDDEIRAEFIAEQTALLAAARREPVEEFRTGCRNLVRFLIAQRDRRTGADTEMELLERQRAASKIRQWADNDTGMHHTHVELDPVRGAKLKKALGRHAAPTPLRRGQHRGAVEPVGGRLVPGRHRPRRHHPGRHRHRPDATGEPCPTVTRDTVT